MSTGSSNTPETSVVDAKTRRVVDELAALATQPVEPHEFFETLLDRVVATTESHAGAVWMCDAEGKAGLAHQLHLNENPLGQPGEEQTLHERLLARVVEVGRPTIVPPQARAADPDDGGNPTEFLLLLAPLVCDERVIGVVELFGDSTLDRTAATENLQVVSQVCGFVSSWLNPAAAGNASVETNAGPADLYQSTEAFSRAIHGNLHLRATAYAIVNEGRQLIGADRVSVAVRRGGRYVIEAVSGQDVFDKRSNTIRLLGSLAKTVAGAEEPLWYEGPTDEMPPQIVEAVNAYVEESLTKYIAVLPLRRPPQLKKSDDKAGHVPVTGEIIGALIVEQIEDVESWSKPAERIELAAEHASRALASAIEHHRVPLMPVWRGLQKARTWFLPKTLPKTLVIMATVVCVLAALFLIPINFTLEGEGVLQPVVRREVFVETPGIAKRIHVEHGQEVEKGDLLVELENIELQVKHGELTGELIAVRDQLRSLRRSLLDDRPLTEIERIQLPSEVGLLQRQRDNLRRQIQLIEQQLAQLKITAPASGQVITWNVEDLLDGRPVGAGEVLMTIADPTGEWELEVYMPESRMGHIAKAADVVDEPLDVSYIQTTHPQTVYRGTLKSIHAMAELHEQEGQSVRLQVEIDQGDLNDPRPGGVGNRQGPLWPPLDRLRLRPRTLGIPAAQSVFLRDEA
jgi:hypothetical protein